jgi:hypothetical protein
VIDWLTPQGFQVTLSPGLVVLERRGSVYSYNTIRSAYESHGGPRTFQAYASIGVKI